jgi:hypothetical protein
MRSTLVCLASIGLFGVGLGERPTPQDDRASLKAPITITVNGSPLDALLDDKGEFVYDNSCPWVGDFDGNGKLTLLIGTHDYRFPPRGKEKDGRPGRLRIYRNVAEMGPMRLSEPIWFDDLVPTGRIPQG